jgi:hypothetical protein
MPQALGSLFVASYDSQGYEGSIRHRLHTVFTRSVTIWRDTLIRGRGEWKWSPVRANRNAEQEMEARRIALSMDGQFSDRGNY